jgi:hypothetical protein
MLPPAIEHYVAELRADPDFGGPTADKFAATFEATDIEADYNNHAGAFLEAICWVVERRDHAVRERLSMIERLTELKGYNKISLKQFTG